MRIPFTRSLSSSWITIALVALVTASVFGGSALGGASRVASAQDGSESPAPSGDSSSEVTRQLPPAELPTGNLRQLNLQLDNTLDTDLGDAPTEADVFSLTIQPRSSDDVAKLADAVGIEGDVEDRGNDTFVVSGQGELFVSPDLVQFLSSEIPTLADLPNDDDSVDFARDWLRSVGLAPADLGDGMVTSRTEAVGRVSVSFSPTEPTEILVDYPTINVVIGPDGVVLEAGVRWADIAVTERYLLRPAEDAWREVESDDSYIEAEFNGAELAVGSEVSGEATYTGVSIAYTTAGAVDGDRFLVPVYVFTGTVEATSGAEGSSEIRAYVPAIVTDDTPVG